MNWIQILAGFLLGSFFGPMLLAKLGGSKKAAY